MAARRRRRRKARAKPAWLSPRQRFWAGVGLVVVSGLVAIGWTIAKRKNRALARELYEAAMAMTACWTRVSGGAQSLADAVDLGFPGAAPLAECREPTLRTSDIAKRLGASYWVKDHGSAAILREQLQDFERLPFADDAAKLASEDMLELLTTLDVWQKSVPVLACSIASAEGVLDRDCMSIVAATTSAEPRVISEVTGASPDSLSIETARNGELLLTLHAARNRPPTWLLHSSDGGATWSSEKHEFLGRGALSGKKAWLVGSDYPNPVRLSEKELPALEKLEPVSVGSSHVELAAGRPALVLGSRAPAPGKVVHLDKSDVAATREIPDGILIGATAGPPPRLYIARPHERGTEITEYVIPAAPSVAWAAEPKRSILSTKTMPSFFPSGDLACGAGKEKYFPILAGDLATGHASLVAASGEKMFAYGFDPPKGAELSPVTGGCPPSVLARSPSGLSLLVPIARMMGTFPVASPAAFLMKDAWKTASAACTSTSYAVAFLSRDRVVIQTSQPKSWSFTSARVIAQADENGTPLSVKLLGSEKLLVAVFLRRSEIGELLRAEVLTSEDSGATFH